MSDDGSKIHFSQESLSLLLTGGATGVPLEHHIPITSSFGDSPIDIADFESKLPRMSSGGSIGSSSSYILYTAPASVSSTVPTVTMSNTDVEIRTDSISGNYEFDLKFEQKKSYAKNYPHCYSREKDTLIVKDHTAIPFTFVSKYSLRDLTMNVLAVFSSKDSFNIPVIPCNNHSGSSQGQTREFITCENVNARNVVEQDRHHIILPLIHCRDVSGNGTEMVENFQFNCRTSCSMKSGSKGINNRQLSLIFQLETNDRVVVGRRVVYLKVAVSPGRDLATLLKQDSNRSRKRSRTASEISGSGKSSPEQQRGHSKKRVKAVKGTGKYTVVCNHKRTLKWITTLAKNTGALDEEYMGDEPASQTSVATQENGSQPENYSLYGWLTRYGLECYTARLEEAGFGNPTNFQCIQDSDLDTLEILDKCHRKTLLHAAKRILIRGLGLMVKGE